MSDTGQVRLFHPKGVAADLPLIGDQKTFFDQVTHYLDQGWLVAEPKLEEGEHEEMAGWALKGASTYDGRTTTYILLYPANERATFSFIKVYLNKDEDAEAFEQASGLRLAQMQEYIGSDKPERGKNPRLDGQYIIRAPRPFGVVIKNNPKWNAEDAAKHQEAKEIYKVPRRIFVRWGQAGAAPPPAAAPIDTDRSIVAMWQKLLDPMTINTDSLNALLPDVKKITHEATRRHVWGMVQQFAQDNNQYWDQAIMKFRSKEEQLAPPPGQGGEIPF